MTFCLGKNRKRTKPLKKTQARILSFGFVFSLLSLFFDRTQSWEKKNINSLMHNLPIDKEVTKKQLIK